MSHIQQSLDQLIESTTRAFERGNAILFLGAGVSMEGKGLSGRELTVALKEQFADVKFATDEFLDVCQDIVETPPHSLDELRNAVRDNLSGIDVPNGHYRMARLPWTAIFTTNYHDVIERAFDHRDCPRACEPIYLEDQRLILPNPRRLHYFKLMGCARRRADEPGDMILTRGQYNRLATQRNRALSALYDALKNGVLVFAGYGFGDRLAFDAIDQLIQEFGLDNLPWSYCIGPSLPSDARGQHQLESRRIIAVEGVFSEFAGEFWDRVRGNTYASRASENLVDVVQLRDKRDTQLSSTDASGFCAITCYRPNCHRTSGRITAVEISGARTGFCRIFENFGEDGTGGPDACSTS